MRLHSVVLLALSVICLLTATNGFSEATAQQLTPTHGELSTEEKHHDGKRSLRGEKIIDDDEEEETEGEERVPSSWLVNIFTPKTAEQIAEARKKTEAVKFYSDLANSPSFRAERFTSWKKDHVGVETLLRHLTLWELDGEKFKAIATKYTEFLASGKLS